MSPALQADSLLGSHQVSPLKGAIWTQGLTQRKNDVETHRENMVTWPEWCISKPRIAKDCQQTPEVRRGKKGLSPRANTETVGLLTPGDSLILDSSLQNCETVHLGYSKPLSLWHFVTAAIGSPHSVGDCLIQDEPSNNTVCSRNSPCSLQDWDLLSVSQSPNQSPPSTLAHEGVMLRGWVFQNLILRPRNTCALQTHLVANCFAKHWSFGISGL